jgi:hypothetical protein
MATSLANTTSTRADSSSRHMLQCRVHRDRLLGWTANRCDNQILQANKHVYSLTKDELAIEVSQSLDKGSDHFSHRSQPYPLVLSSFEGMSESAQNVYACLMATDTPFHTHRKEIFKVIRHDNFKKSLHDESEHYHCKTIPYFRAMGYSVGTAYAHENTGDTIASVMIGGITTALNGAFPMQTGDRVMWYLAKSETGMFDSVGIRIHDKDNTNPMKLDAIKQVQPFDYQAVSTFIQNTKKSGSGFKKDEKAKFNLQRNGFDLGGKQTKMNIALIKPFHYKNASQGDYERVFATCISPADKYEMVDIMISRQSL